MLIGEGGNEGLLVGLVGDEERVDKHGTGVEMFRDRVQVEWYEARLTFVNCRSACHDRARGWL